MLDSFLRISDDEGPRVAALTASREWARGRAVVRYEPWFTRVVKRARELPRGGATAEAAANELLRCANGRREVLECARDHFVACLHLRSDDFAATTALQAVSRALQQAGRRPDPTADAVVGHDTPTGVRPDPFVAVTFVMAMAAVIMQVIVWGTWGDDHHLPPAAWAVVLALWWATMFSFALAVAVALWRQHLRLAPRGRGRARYEFHGIPKTLEPGTTRTDATESTGSRSKKTRGQATPARC